MLNSILLELAWRLGSWVIGFLISVGTPALVRRLEWRSQRLRRRMIGASADRQWQLFCVVLRINRCRRLLIQWREELTPGRVDAFSRAFADTLARLPERAH